MANIIVLGGGRVGSAIATLMSKKHSVTVLDYSVENRIQTNSLKFIHFDFHSLETLESIISTADILIGAVPGDLGYRVLQRVIEAGKHIVDISFFPESGLKLNALAKKNKVIAAIDAGVAPGMDNILLGHHDSEMKITGFKCLVGGLPLIKNHPFNYKAPFSPADVVEEYTRPARIMRDKKVIALPALTETESIQVNKLGRLEAFNSDGLRSLLHTMKHIPNMVEKTIRYPGHAQQMFLLRELGLLSKIEIQIGDQKVVPLQLTSKLLFHHWRYKPGEKDQTIMRVEIKGIENKKKVQYIYDLHDEYDTATQMSSMARTTGITACAVAECILSGKWKKTGVIPPEFIGMNSDCFDFIMDYQKKMGIKYRLKKKMN